MKAVTKSKWGLGIHLATWNMWNQDQKLRLLLSIHISWEMICQAKQDWKIFEFQLWEIAKYKRNNMLNKSRQKNMEKFNSAQKFSILGLQNLGSGGGQPPHRSVPVTVCKKTCKWWGYASIGTLVFTWKSEWIQSPLGVWCVRQMSLVLFCAVWSRAEDSEPLTFPWRNLVFRLNVS